MSIPGMPEARFVETNGIKIGFYEAGEGPPIVLMHGWPELAFSWRHQIPALAAAGYRVIAPDQRGYGITECPPEIEAYDIANLAADLVGLLDALELEKAVWCGHDWGALLAWQMPLLHPDRTAGVIGLNAPFAPRLPLEPINMLRFAFGEMMYVIQFQEPGVVESLLEQHVDRFFRAQMREGVITLAAYESLPREFRNLDFISPFRSPEPDALPGEPILSDEERAVFVEAFQRTGFGPGINWYRNLTRNWEASRDLRQISRAPSLMISAAEDVVLPPSLTDGMELYVPDLEKAVIQGCGHWTQQEAPDEVNRLIVDWLDRRSPFESIAPGVVGRLVAGMASGDMEEVSACLHPEVSWEVMGADYMETGPRYEGKRAVMEEFFEATAVAAFDWDKPFSFQPRRVTADGGAAAVEVLIEATAAVSGDPYRNSYCFVFEVDGTLVTGVREYMDTAQAKRVLFAAGT